MTEAHTMCLEDEDCARWSDADVWDVFLTLLEREAPVAGLSLSVSRYREAGLETIANVRREHSAFDNRYYRTNEKAGIVNPVNIEHLTRLVHYFSQKIAGAGGAELLLDCLFYILKSRCQINLFYRQSLPEYFFALHAIGAVLGYGDYGRFLMVHQGSTIGESHGRYPKLGDGVVLGPQSMVLGDCDIGDNVWVGAGALVIDTNVPANSLVFGRMPDLTIKENSRDNRSVWFDMEMVDAA